MTNAPSKPRVYGGRTITEDQLRACLTPAGTRTHKPIPHSMLLDEAVAGLGRYGLEVASSEFAVEDGKLGDVAIPNARFFGILGLSASGSDSKEYQLLACLRNAHDKKSSAMFGVGMSVMICTNMSFSAEVKIGRKHTPRILFDLRGLIRNALLRLPSLRQNQDARIEAYKRCNATDDGARVAIMRACEKDFISPSKTLKVWNEWKQPRHSEFSPRNAWSLFNAFTEVMKEYRVEDNPRRTVGLHSYFDEATKVALN